MDRRQAIDQKTRALERMLIHGQRALSALEGIEAESIESEVLTRLAGELAAQHELLDECRLLDEALPTDREQWAAWLEAQTPQSRRSTERAVDDLARMTDQAARVEAQVGQCLGRLQDEIRPKLERVRAGHRILKAYLQPRPNVPRIVDRQE